MKTIKLSDCKNMLRIIAAAMIREHGFYICEINGERVKVVK